jgi:hypothetical protein
VVGFATATAHACLASSFFALFIALTTQSPLMIFKKLTVLKQMPSQIGGDEDKVPKQHTGNPDEEYHRPIAIG